MTATADLDLPPDDPQRILTAPFSERVKLVCQSWAAQTHPTPVFIVAAYWVKYLLIYIAGWAFFVSFDRGYPGFPSPGEWAFTAGAFEKAILWSILYEIAGLGCSFGPMNARFIPPIGGYLYFMRPGTTKLALFPNVKLIGGIRRTWLDVILHAANAFFLLRALVAPEVTPALLLPPLVLIALLGILDKTVFLAARGEHYWLVLLCLWGAGGHWIAACKVIWCAIWFWAATSKVNHHFPSVVMVMINNGPFFPKRFKRRLFANYPDDLRPARLAAVIAHAGTFTEYMIPVILLSSESPLLTAIGLFTMAGFHGFISLCSPNGMPIEWNILMIYGGIFLFGVHPEASILTLAAHPLLAAVLFLCLVAVPCFGNFVPARVSFLLAMRYYAGNWAYNIWLVRRGSAAKFDALTKVAGSLREQLKRMLGSDEEVEATLARMMFHRFMHLQGRPLLEALPRAVDNIDNYEWMEGEVLGGSIIGWNFGDGHLNGEQLLQAVQAQCGFEEKEVRVVMVESQPLFGRTMHWKVVDAKTGLVAEGETAMAPMHELQPWPTGEYAEGFGRERAHGLVDVEK
jgi:hypothetical protein